MKEVGMLVVNFELNPKGNRYGRDSTFLLPPKIPKY